MSMLAPPSLASRLDLNKCMKMCLIHDMAESLVGDITPVDGVAKPEKSRREATTMDYITKSLLGNIYGGKSTAGEDIRAIWQEYEDSKTLESIYVHDIDKVELLLQMIEYERRGREQGRGEADKLDLGEFAYVATRIALPETKEWAAKLLEEREELWGKHEHVHGEEGIKGGVRTETAQAQDTYYQKQ
jgi:putative hydrolase of HD superfamily